MATILDKFVVDLSFRLDPSALRRAERTIQRTRQKLDSFAAGAFRIGAGLTAAATGAVVSFAGVEAELAKIEGLVGVSREQLTAWQKDLDAIAGETGQGPQQLAEALFFVTSAGLRGSVAIDVLRKSARAAAAGLGDQSTIADLVTSALNAYGSETLSAAQATDALTEAVRLGKLEPATLANAMGRVLPIASAMGVKFSEVAGILAAMSKTGTTAEEGVTQVSAILSAILKPADGAEKALAGVGLSAGGLRDVIAKDGLFAALQTINTAFGGAKESMAEVFPNIRALRGLFDLLGPQMASNVTLLDDMKDSTGVLDEAFDAAAKTLKYKWNRALAVGQTFVNDLGRRLAPLAGKVLDFAKNMLKATETWPDSLKNALTVILATGPALLALGAAAKVASFGLGLMSTALAPLAVLSGPIILAIAAAALLLYAAWKPLSTFFGGVFEGLISGIKPIGEAFGRLFDELGPLGDGLRWLGRQFSDLFSMDATAEGFNFGGAIVDGIVYVIDSITDFIKYLKNTSWGDIGRDLINALIDGILSRALALYDTLKGVFNKAKDLMPFSDAKEGPFSRLTESGKAIVDTLADGIRHAQPLKVALMAGALAAPLPVGPLPTPHALAGGQQDQARGQGDVVVTLEAGAIQITAAPDATGPDIAQLVADAIGARIRAATEQSDSQVRA